MIQKIRVFVCLYKCHSVAQAGLELDNSLVSVSRLLELQVCVAVNILKGAAVK